MKLVALRNVCHARVRWFDLSKKTKRNVVVLIRVRHISQGTVRYIHRALASLIGLRSAGVSGVSALHLNHVHFTWRKLPREQRGQTNDKATLESFKLSYHQRIDASYPCPPFGPVPSCFLSYTSFLRAAQANSALLLARSIRLQPFLLCM
mmetsp:Transcript_15169/g.34990  ORF Transcript_15169/g.34990 Transcript_15169/m.34990 type:complete len:150 (-) Transcript_15169:150-599(-)